MRVARRTEETTLSSYRVMSLDISYRNTGGCVMRVDDDCPTILETFCLENPKMEFGFDGMFDAHKAMRRTILEAYRKALLLDVHVMILEMPCYTQDAKSALAIGLCWGEIACIDNLLLVDPTALKKWSGSKRGDGKAEVKAAVMNRATLSAKDLSNDNIVDAVGLSLLFVDTVKRNKLPWIP